MTSTRTIYLDNPTEEQRSTVVKFFDDNEFEVTWANAREDADVVIDWPDGKEVCEPDLLHCGGRTTCPNAFVFAKKLKIDRGDMGKLLNHLNIRITSCQLGCFK